MDQNNIIDSVIEIKQFHSYKVISRGKFAATIEVDYKEKQKKKSILILSKIEWDNRRFDIENIQNGFTVKAIKYEYMCKLQTYIIYTESAEHTLKDKVADKDFRRSPGAVEAVCKWIKEVSLGLKKIHSHSYLHLNIHPKTILITSDNVAKVGGFDYLRHSSTLTSSSEYGSERHYHPPERCPSDCGATDGKKFDVWCLTMLAVESLTGNYVAPKSSKVTSWPERYHIMHKILQAPKFMKIVKQSYPKAAKGEFLEQILRLIKHTLKCHPEERPNIGEFSLLMLELTFLKYIDKELVAEEMWNKKVTLNELEVKMLNMALKRKPSCASLQTKNKFGEGFPDRMLFNESYEAENIHYGHPRSQTTSSNRKQYIAVENEYNTKNKQVVLPDDVVSSKKFSENVTMKKQDSHNPKKSEKYSNDRTSGDFVSEEFDGKNKETEEFSFEHTDLYASQDSTSGKDILKSEQIFKSVPYEKPIANKDLQKSTDAEKQISKQEKQSQIFDTDISNDNIHIAQKQADLVACKTEKHFNKCHKENTSYTSTSKWIFGKMINWALEDIFYAGVMQSGSFISKLSKDLTG